MKKLRLVINVVWMLCSSSITICLLIRSGIALDENLTLQVFQKSNSTLILSLYFITPLVALTNIVLNKFIDKKSKNINA